MKNLSAFFPALRPEFNDIVSFCDDLDIVLDDHDGVVFFNQTVKQVNEFSSVGRVEPYGGFLQNVKVGFFDRPCTVLALVDARGEFGGEL